MSKCIISDETSILQSPNKMDLMHIIKQWAKGPEMQRAGIYFEKNSIDTLTIWL